MRPALGIEELERWLTRYGQAWEAGDADAAAALFTADAVYRETPFDSAMTGRDAIRAYWRAGAGDGQTGVRFESSVGAVAGDIGFAHWRASFTRVASGARVALDGMFRLTFQRTADGAALCARLEEWWHRREDPPSLP